MSIRRSSLVCALIASLALSSADLYAQSAVRVASSQPDGAVAVACANDHVSAWKITIEIPPARQWTSAASCARDSLRVTTDGGALFVDPALRALVRIDGNGAELYRVALSSPSWGAPLVVDQSLVLRLSDGAVQWRSLSDGALRFYRRTEAAADPRALLTPGAPLLVRTRDGSRVCVPRTGSFECWSSVDGRSMTEFAAPEPVHATGAALAVDLDHDGDDELLVATQGGGVSAIDRAGSVRWTQRGPSRSLVLATPIAFSIGRAALAAWVDVDGWVQLVELRTGAIQQGFPRRSEGASRVGVRVGDVDGDGAMDLLVSARSGSLSAFSVRDGAAVSVGEGPSVAAPIDGEPLLVATGDGVVHWLAVDGANALAHRALAATALGADTAVIVGEPEARPAFSIVGSEINRSAESQAIVSSSAVVSPRVSLPAASCAATPATSVAGTRGWIALLLGALATGTLRGRARRAAR